MPDKPWRPFRVGTPSTRANWVNSDCRPFDQVSHVTHIPTAITVIRQNQMIRPQLVYDESILNTRRILVTWLSPNHWTRGYRYGNVSFDIPWNTIIEDKNYYWVETIEKYSPPACRILITGQNYDSDPELIPYDPTDGDGPWWLDESENVHYRNGDICLEIMLEAELGLAACKEISFVKHHDEMCSVEATTCVDLGLGHQEAAARFLAGIISEDLDVRTLNLELQGGWWWLIMNIPENGYVGHLGINQPDTALARAAAFAYYQNQSKEFVHLCGLFSDKAVAKESFQKLVKAAIPDLDVG